MNIMKTNLLLLDNKIRKDDGEQTSTATVAAPSATNRQAGINALMFQGMQNLMANPALAKEVGVMNDDNTENKTSNSSASNVAFQGKFSKFASGVKEVGSKFSQGVPAGIIMTSTLLPSVVTFTSCDDKEYISVPATEYKTEVTVNVNFKEFSGYVQNIMSMMDSYWTQQLMNQKITYEQWQKYIDQNAEWQQKMLEKVSSMEQRMANMEAVLMDMGDNIIDVKNGVKEGNALQQLMITLLTKQGMSIAQANLYLQNLINEVRAGNKTVAQAMAELIEQLNKVNENLDTIITNQNNAYEQQKEVISILNDVKGDTQAMRAAVKMANMQLFSIHSAIVDGNKQVVTAIYKLDGDLNAGIDKVAATLGWSTAQVIAYMNKLGIDIQRNNNWNASMILAAINYNTYVTEQGNKTLEELKADFEAGLITAEEYANAILNVLNDIDSKVDTLVTSFNSYAAEMKNAAQIAISELRIGNKTAKETNVLLVEVLKNQQKADAMRQIMIQKLEKIDIDINKGVDELAAKLGCSTAQIISMLQWLGYSEAQIATMNAGAIINAIKSSSFSIGNQLNTIINNMGNGDNVLSQEEIDTIIALLTSIDQGVENNGDKLDELIELVKTLTEKIDNYAQKALNAYASFKSYLADIKASLLDLGNKVNVLINYAKNAEEQRTKTYNEITNIRAQINQLINQHPGSSITPEQLDEMLGKYTKILIDELKIDIKPTDFSSIEEYLIAIDAKLAEANKKLEWQAQTNKILLDILEAVKKLDRNAPDYNDKLNQIIELLKNFKCECNCQGDCDENEAIHEGVIDIIS